MTGEVDDAGGAADELARAGALDAAYAVIDRQLAGSGADLSLYQRGAVLRRIARRMRLLELARVDDYAERVSRDPAEARLLARELQQPQQSVFRDPQAAEALQQVLATLLLKRAAPQVWVPMCGTGDEVWAVAMLLAQAQAGMEMPLNFRIYGTDNDTEALRHAARGTVAAADRVPPLLRDRYLAAQAGGMQVSRRLQSHAVFLRHELLLPSPFFALDLVCCRHLLGVLEPAALRRALHLLHGAMRPGAALMLGRLEPLSGHEDLFVADGRIPGLHRRSEGTSRRALPVVPRIVTSQPVLAVLPRPALLLDERFDIVESNAHAQALGARFARGPLLQGLDAADHGRVLDALRGLGTVPQARLGVHLRDGPPADLSLARLAVPAGEAWCYAELAIDDGDAALRAQLATFVSRSDTLLRTTSNGVIVLDGEGQVTEFNPVAERLTGWTRTEALGQPHARVFRLNIANDPEHPVERALLGVRAGSDRNDLYLQHRDGRRYALTLRARAVPAAASGNDAAAVAGVVLAFEDVSEMNLLTEELAYRATHDPLTGLLNRDEFESRTRAALAEAKSLGTVSVLCYLDVDQFKIINDTLGHVAGDELLHELAGELRSQVSEGDVLARLGGDEFGVLLVGRDLKSARPVVDGLIEAARRFRFYWSGQTHAITVSAGAAIIDASADTVAGAMSMADAACFVAKDAGRDRARYAGDDDELSRRYLDMSLVGKIGKSIDENRFVLHYEDVVRLDAPEEVVYRELLVRMRDEDGKLYTPGAFIQAAERFFLMSALDRWVIARALRDIARLPADPVIYAINLSGQSLGDDKFLDFVLNEIDDSGVDPARVCFEITETSAVSRLTEAVRFISRVAETGCRFALDDFGAGMASFSYLKNFRVDFLKIDGSFVRAMLGSRADRGMVDSINRIGHEFGLKTIAEHVESSALMEPLREMGVDWAQGRAIAWGRPFDGLLS